MTSKQEFFWMASSSPGTLLLCSRPPSQPWHWKHALVHPLLIDRVWEVRFFDRGGYTRVHPEPFPTLEEAKAFAEVLCKLEAS